MSRSTTPELHYVTDGAFLSGVKAVAAQLTAGDWSPDFIIGIGRGGLVPAVYLSHLLDRPMLSVDHSAKVPGFSDELLGKVATSSAAGTRLLFVDDINDTGGTIAYIRDLLTANGCDSANLRFAVVVNNCQSRVGVDYCGEVIDRRDDKRWFVFPWEAVATADALLDEARAVPERLA